MDTLVGQIIGNYEILRELGRGGMGVVYKAHESSLNRTVALKVLPEKFAANEGFLARFQREARAAAQFSHPNVVTIYNIGKHEGPEGVMPYIAMEYVKGRTIAELIEEEGQIEIKQAVEIARQAAGALAAAHELRIVHRDIKPHNIMIDGAGRVKVMDFGIARVGEDMGSGLTKAGDVLGTPTYMSPEQCRGTDIDGRTDLYSLGVVLYEMIAGAAPFTGETAIVVVQKILFEPPPSILECNRDVPAAVTGILEKALAKDLSQRYASAADMEADLAWALAGGHVTIEPPVLEDTVFAVSPAAAITQAIPRIVHSRKAQAIAGGIAFALLLVLGAALALKKPSSPNAQARGLDGTPIAIAALSPSPAPSAAPVAPQQLVWTEGPEEGAKIPVKEVRLAWKMNNNLIAEGFLVGLNEDRPSTRTLETARTFALVKPGEQSVTVIPIIAGGVEGEPYRRKFVYEPNEPPKLAASLERTTIKPGEAAQLLVQAEDPDGDAVVFEARIDGGGWSPIRAGGQPLAGLADGKHQIEARAVDARGMTSESWTESLHVATPAELLKEVVQQFTGVGGPADEAKARETLLREASVDAPLLQMWLAWFYRWGRCGLEPDLEKSELLARGVIDPIRALADSGSLDATFLLGAALDAGLGVPEDRKKSVELVTRAAEAGHSTAINYLGYLHVEGKAVPKDHAKARTWFEKGAEMGDVSSMNNLGNLLKEGLGGKKDEALAAEWFRKGADKGSARSMTSLGFMHERGLGVKKDKDAAIELYMRAAHLGDPTAQRNLLQLGRTWR